MSRPIRRSEREGALISRLRHIVAGQLQRAKDWRHDVEVPGRPGEAVQSPTYISKAALLRFLRRHDAEMTNDPPTDREPLTHIRECLAPCRLCAVHSCVRVRVCCCTDGCCCLCVRWCQAAEKEAYRQRFDQARKAVAHRRALRFGSKLKGVTVANKHQQFSGAGHSLV